MILSKQFKMHNAKQPMICAPILSEFSLTRERTTILNVSINAMNKDPAQIDPSEVVHARYNDPMVLEVSCATNHHEATAPTCANRNKIQFIFSTNIDEFEKL
jgi:hypothetical protein